MLEANKPIRKTVRPCPEESKNWDTTENLYIEDDNPEVLKLLQESCLGKVKMIYIDPPYNTAAMPAQRCRHIKIPPFSVLPALRDVGSPFSIAVSSLQASLFPPDTSESVSWKQ